MEGTPLISVIMGLYNCELTLNNALESIINQTYTNWEVVMCDDGSSDRTIQIAQSFVERFPNKFFLLKNEENKGLNYTLNRCLTVARGDYIARMDGDDFSIAERFEKEIDFLRNNPQFSIVSSSMILFDENGEWGSVILKEFPTSKDIVKSTPFCHGPCMVRKTAYKTVGGYSIDEKLLRVEDYHLWVKMYAAGFIGANLQEPLYKAQDDANAQKRRKFKYRINEARVKVCAVKLLKLPCYNYIHCLRPIIIGLLPGFLYKLFHRKKQNR